MLRINKIGRFLFLALIPFPNIPDRLCVDDLLSAASSSSVALTLFRGSALSRALDPPDFSDFDLDDFDFDLERDLDLDLRRSLFFR